MPPRLFPSRGFAAKSVPESKAVAVQMPQPAFWLDGNPVRNDLHHDYEIGRGSAFGVSSLVYACMSFRARKLAEPALWLADEQDGNEAWLPGTADHPLSALLEQPNPDQHAAAFLASLSLAMDMGPTLVVKNRDRAKRVAALYVFDYGQFSVEPAVIDGVAYMAGKFTVTDRTGRQTVLLRPDVLYFPTLGNVAPLDAALAHVRISDTMRRAVKSSLAKSMRPGAVVTLSGGLQPEQFDRYHRMLSAKHSGPENTGTTILLDGQDVKYQQLAATLKDLELGPVQGDVEAAICQAFAVHPALVGAKIALENSSGLSDSLKPALSLFYDLAAFPRWAEIETAFTAGLLREVDPSPVRFVRFVKDDVRALQPDLVANVNVAKAATGIMTLNEQRATLALPPLGGPEGDVIAQPQGTGQAPNDPQATGGAPGAPQKAVDAGTAPERKATPAPYATKAARLATDADRDAFWHAFDQKAQAGVLAYEAAALARFREERAGVLATLRASVPKMRPAELEQKDDTGGTIDRTDEMRAAWEAPYIDAALYQIAADFAPEGPYAMAWAEEYRTLLRVTMQGAAESFAAGFGVQFSMDNPAFTEAIRARAERLAKLVTQTTADAITEAIASGRAEGLTIEQIAKRIDERAFGATARQRARTIADTEVVGAINDAEWRAATQSDVFRSKRWIHTRRSEGRKHHNAHEHEGANGGWVPMDYRYQYTTKSGGGSSLRPHEAGMPASELVNCGCTLAFSDVDPAQAEAESKAIEDAERQRKLVDAAIVALAREPQPVPAPVVHVTIPPAPKGGTKRVLYDVDADGRHVATLEEVSD